MLFRGFRDFLGDFVIFLGRLRRPEKTGPKKCKIPLENRILRLQKHDFFSRQIPLENLILEP